MDVKKIAAFSHQHKGGNPAGVHIADELPSDERMLEIAEQVGYSETAFLKPHEEGWRIRYFAPQTEVPFCGHATIANTAELGLEFGVGEYKLYLNDGQISIAVSQSPEGVFTTTLQSPNTWSKAAEDTYVTAVLHAFGLNAADLDPDYPPRIAFAGARHLILVLKDRRLLGEMAYEMEALGTLMGQESLITINLLWAESDRRFHARNPFPPGGVYEDPATGAAAAALAGYLRDIYWQGSRQFEVLQGEDMGVPSLLMVSFGPTPGESISVTGETRFIGAD